MFPLKGNQRNRAVRFGRTCAALEELESRRLLSAGHGVVAGIEIIPGVNGTAIVRSVTDIQIQQDAANGGLFGDQTSVSLPQLRPHSQDADDVDRKPDGASTAADATAQAIPNFVINTTTSTGTAVYNTVASQATAGWWQVGAIHAATPQSFGTVAQTGQQDSPRSGGTADGSANALPQDGQMSRDGGNGASVAFGDAPAYGAVLWLGDARASYFLSRLMAVESTMIWMSSGGAIMVTGETFRTDPRDFDLTNIPPPPPRAAAATEQPQTATVQQTGQQSDPPMQLTLASMPAVTTQAEMATARQNAPMATSDSSAMAPSLHTNIRHPDEVLTSQYTGLAVNFGTNLAITGLEWEVSAVTGTTTSAAGREFVDGLLEADATALAQIANTLTLRLNDENAMLWKETLAFLGGAVLVGSYLAKERQSSRPPGKKANSPRHLCVGEEQVGVARYSGIR